VPQLDRAGHVYVMLDKALAVRLSLLATLTMCPNYVLKIFVKNPRPIHPGRRLPAEMGGAAR
jgi:hypothetical protein